jgi:hypothetical protein
MLNSGAETMYFYLFSAPEYRRKILRLYGRPISSKLHLQTVAACRDFNAQGDCYIPHTSSLFSRQLEFQMPDFMNDEDDEQLDDVSDQITVP